MIKSSIIKQFAKVTNKQSATKQPEVLVYGTIVGQNGEYYFKMDGSDVLTPVAKTADVEDGNRVTAVIKDHRVVVDGNITDPSVKGTQAIKLANDVQQELDTLDGYIEIDESSGKMILGERKSATANTITSTGWQVTQNNVVLAEIIYGDMNIERVNIAERLDIGDLKIRVNSGHVRIGL